MEINIEYGEPSFMDGSKRFIKVTSDAHDIVRVYYRTVYVQGLENKYIKDPENNIDLIDNMVLEIFTRYKSKFNKEDKRLFKEYFNRE
jgi:hypothetical protein